MLSTIGDCIKLGVDCTDKIVEMIEEPVVALIVRTWVEDFS
jgi:hypothetical protein